MALRRPGSWFDPAVVLAFERAARDPAMWAALHHGAEAMALAEADVEETFVVGDAYLDDVAEAFADVVDAKSPYTAGHSRRVAIFADAIATSVGFDVEQCKRLRRAALLHDVGKLGVSNMVLEKPGKLDEAEWVAMRAHPVNSEAILSRIAVFADAARIGGAHPERLDGQGYPNLRAPLGEGPFSHIALINAFVRLRLRWIVMACYDHEPCIAQGTASA